MLHRLLIRLLLPVGLGLAGHMSQALAQYAEHDFVRYSVKDGLSDNAIGSMLQDDEGYLWIGTGAGLNRFDGHQFKSYYQGTAPLYLPSGSIVRLKRFGPHQLGIISQGGFQLLNTRAYTMRHFNIPDSSAFITYLNTAWDAIELPDHGYAVTMAAGFYIFNADGTVSLRYDAYSIDDIGKRRILYGRDIMQVTSGTLLIYTDEGGVATYDVMTKTFTPQQTNHPEWSRFITPERSDDAYWIVKQQLSRDEYLFIPNESDVIIYYHQQLKKEIASPLPFQVHEVLSWESKIEMLNDSVLVMNDRTNGFYFLHINRKTGQIQCDGKKYLPGYKILCLYADKDHRLWVGTTEGLLKQKIQLPAIRAYHYPPATGEKYGWGFTCTYRHDDLLYAGRFSGNNGLAIIRADDMSLVREVTLFESGSAWNQVLSIEMYHPDTLWIGTAGGMLWYATQTGRYGKLQADPRYKWAESFYGILAPPHPDGNAWMCSLLDGKVARYNIATRTTTMFNSQTTPALPFNKVKSVVYDYHGDVWIGGHSLTRWNNQLQQFDTLITVYGGANKYNDDIVALSADKDGSLWLHNAGNGLLEYHIGEKRFVPYTMQDGLPSDVLQSLSLVQDHKLWIASNNHLTLFDTRTKKCTVYTTDDGLPEQKPTGRRIAYDPSNGNLYLCSNEHLSVFPLAPEEKPDSSSELLVEELTIDNEKTYYHPDHAIRMHYDQNNVRIHFTVIDFEKSNYQFAYRLNHADHWTVLGNQHNISLDNLTPGDYVLELRASGKPGIEKTSALAFTISPPFWKNAWFITSALMLLIGGVYALFRNRVRHIRQRATIDKRLAETEMKALQAQMNPHFIFNSLNSIGEMILNNENKEASHYLSKFARLIRITLDQSSQSLVSLRNTIDYLERYMEMEHIRNSYFTHQITVDRALDIDDTWVPPMLIQPFIENALWHGVSSSAKNIHVRIDFRQDKDNLVCTIDDNGIGINQTQHNKTDNGRRHAPVGIVNIQNRVALLNEKYNLHGFIQVIDKKDIPGTTEPGTRVTLQIPLDIEAL